MLRTGEVRFIAEGDWGRRPNLVTSLSLSGDVIVAVEPEFWGRAPADRRRAIVEEHVRAVADEIERMAPPADLIRRWARRFAIAYTGGSAIAALLLHPPSAMPVALVVAFVSRFAPPGWLLLPLRPIAMFYIRRLFRRALRHEGLPAG